MKKRFLFGALMFSAIAMAQATDYKGAVVCRSQELVKSQTVLSDVQLTEGGDCYLAGTFGSLQTTDTSYFADAAFTGAYYGTGNSYNKNFVLLRTDGEQQSVRWLARSVEGECANNASGNIVATRDGGVVAMLQMRFTEAHRDGGEDIPMLYLVDGVGDTLKLTYTAEGKRPYMLYIVRFDKEGRLTHYTTLWSDYSKGSYMSPYALTEDENGNIYLSVGQIADMAIGKDTLHASSHSAGWDGNIQNTTNYMATTVIKLRSDLTYDTHRTATSDGIATSLKSLLYTNGHLYMAGTTAAAKADDPAFVGMGKVGVSVTGKNLLTVAMDTLLHTQYMQPYATCSIGNAAFQMMQYGATMAADSKSYYVTGGMIGGILLSETDSILTGGKKSGCWNGAVLQVDAATGKISNHYVRYQALDAALGGTYYAWHVAEQENGCYIPGYRLGMQWIDRFDSELNLLGSDTIATGGGMSVLIGANSKDDRLYLSLRARNTGDYAVGTDTYNRSVYNSWYSVIGQWQLDEIESDTPSAIEPVSMTENKADKIILNGQMYIRRSGILYDMTGRRAQ